jgi:hypothetical protein
MGMSFGMGNSVIEKNKLLARQAQGRPLGAGGDAKMDRSLARWSRGASAAQAPSQHKWDVR